MKEILYVIIGLVVGYVGGLRMGMRTKIAKAPTRSSRDEGRGVGDETSPINPAQVEEKRQHKEQILALTDAEITNDRIELALGVSNATAERYLNELEHEGKLVQVGKTGQNVTYKKI